MPKNGNKRPSDASRTSSISEHSYEEAASGLMQIKSEDEYQPLHVTPSNPQIAIKPTLMKASYDGSSPNDVVCTLSNLINMRSESPLREWWNLFRVNSKPENYCWHWKQYADQTETSIIACLLWISEFLIIIRSHIVYVNQLL